MPTLAGGLLPPGVEVTSSSATAYSVVQASSAGTMFTIAKDSGGTISRTCDRHGEGTCPASGEW